MSLMNPAEPKHATRLSPSKMVAAKLRALFAERNLKSKDLAQALRISQSAASRRLNGQHDFRVNELEQIETWQALPAGWLLIPGEPPYTAPQGASRAS